MSAGLTSILAKCGLRDVDSTVATAFRTVVVAVFSWTIVAIGGTYGQMLSMSPETWGLLIISGLLTGASWLCYFKALQAGDVNKVVPVDKSSTVMGIILAIILLGESISAVGAVGAVLIFAGTMLMIEKKDVDEMKTERRGWLLFALGSAVFAALTSIAGKAGMDGIDSNLGTAVRTVVVLVMSWIMVFAAGKREDVRGIGRRDAVFLVLSGLATGVSWLFFFGALQSGPASVVVPIDKLSILVTAAFSCLVLKERLSARSAAGLAGISTGTMLLLVRRDQSFMGRAFRPASLAGRAHSPDENTSAER